jgi:hypothetical protein
MPATHDFTKGPFTFKVTAGDTTKEYVIEVKEESPAPPSGPEPSEPETPGNGGGGCNANMGMIGLLALAWGLRRR